MTYYAAKMSFIKRSLIFFTQEAITESPIILAEKAIIEAPGHVTAPQTSQKWRQVKGHIDFYIGNVLNEEDRLIAFQIAKKRIRPRGTYSDKTFGEVEEEHFPASTILWSRDTQTILIEKPGKDQMTVKSIIKNLISYLNGRLAEYGYVMLIAQLPYKSTFWQIVDKYETKYSIEFILFAPNFLDAGSSARELAESNKKEFGANKTSIKIMNEEGRLQIRKGIKFIEECLARIDTGTGKWVIWVGIDNKRKPISSESDSKVLEKDLPEYNMEIVKDFTAKAIESIRDIDEGGEGQPHKGTNNE
jgi:hypothetical protein